MDKTYWWAVHAERGDPGTCTLMTSSPWAGWSGLASEERELPLLGLRGYDPFQLYFVLGRKLTLSPKPGYEGIRFISKHSGSACWLDHEEREIVKQHLGNWKFQGLWIQNHSTSLLFCGRGRGWVRSHTSSSLCQGLEGHFLTATAAKECLLHVFGFSDQGCQISSRPAAWPLPLSASFPVSFLASMCSGDIIGCPLVIRERV